MKKTNLLSILFLAAFGSLFFVACTEENDDPEPVERTLTGDEFTYEVHTAPIFNNLCAVPGCHTAGAGIGSLANFEDARDFAQGGRILGTMRHESGFSPMPRNAAKASDQIIETVEKWIEDGYLERI